MTRTEKWMTLKFSGFISSKRCLLLFYMLTVEIFLLSHNSYYSRFFSYSSSLPSFVASCYSSLTAHFSIEIMKKKKKEKKKIMLMYFSLNDYHCWCIVFFSFSCLPGWSDIDDTMSICTCCPLHVHTNTHTKLC